MAAPTACPAAAAAPHAWPRLAPTPSPERPARQEIGGGPSWKREHVQRIAVRRMVDIGSDHARDIPRTAAAQARRHRDILLPADGERHWVTLHRRPQPRLPKLGSILHID